MTDDPKKRPLPPRSKEARTITGRRSRALLEYLRPSRDTWSGPKGTGWCSTSAAASGAMR